MGLLMDQSRLSYTLDADFSKLVIHAFSKLYHDQLIYKGKKMVNWDVKLQTAISDLEVVYKTEKNKLYYLKYYLVENKEEYLEVATSRPETIFADVCLFVNPHDARYTRYIGKKIINPLNQKEMPVLADESVLIDFGTGVLKCTPAHDYHDYELGIKYNLICEICLDSKGYLNKLAGKYQGLERFAARKKIIEDLQKTDICFQIETYESNIGYSQRSNVVIEPYLSTQWFLSYRK
jgi:valyl-tRNA synthetase